MTATVLLVWAIFGGLNKQEIIGIDLVLLIVIAITIWARWRRQQLWKLAARGKLRPA